MNYRRTRTTSSAFRRRRTSAPSVFTIVISLRPPTGRSSACCSRRRHQYQPTVLHAMPSIEQPSWLSRNRLRRPSSGLVTPLRAHPVALDHVARRALISLKCPGLPTESPSSLAPTRVSAKPWPTNSPALGLISLSRFTLTRRAPRKAAAVSRRWGGRRWPCRSMSEMSGASSPCSMSSRGPLGTPDVLVNNAGVGGSGATVLDMRTEEFDRVLKTDLYGPFFLLLRVHTASAEGRRRRQDH